MQNLKSHRSLWVSILAALFLVVCLAPGSADAKRKKKRRRKPAAAKVNVQALGQLMGPFKFGMNKKEVFKVLKRQLDERFKDRIKETTDIYQQDILRRQKKTELKKVMDSFSEFTGVKTGWDVSIIDDQFGHNSDESMVVYWENNADGNDQRRFFFFHDGSLFKMFIALNSSMLQQDQRTFAFFQSAMEKRYGSGKVVYHKKRDGEEYPALVDWNSPKFHVQAIDKLNFYGNFCLMVADPSTEAIVMAARDANKETKRGSPIIDSMLEGDDAPPPSLDSNKSALDSIIN